MTQLQRIAAASAAVLCLVSTLQAHEGDPKLRDRQPSYAGPGWRNAQRRGPDGNLVENGSTVDFPRSNVTLLSWLSLDDLGQPASGNGNSCFGYVSPSGREYAVIGLYTGTAFVEITQPGNPLIVGEIPGPQSLWRDVKVFQNYCYAVSEGGGGIQVINLANIDNGVVTLVNTVNDDSTSSTHTLALNPQSGYLYRSGGGSQGIRVYNLNANPAAPQRVGTWSDRYSHEVSVFSYTSGPAAGRELAYVCGGFNTGYTSTGLYVVDVTNKANPVLVKYVPYPNSWYAHQVWPSPDGQWLYLNDELDDDNLGLTCRTRVFNNSNPLDVTYHGFFTNGETSVDHNLYTRGNLIFESNYRTGLRVFQTTAPGTPTNPVEIAWFDTWPEDDAAEFNGLWNNYPYFPSGVVIGSDIEKGLFVWWVGTPPVAISLPGGEPATLPPAGGAVAVTIVESSPGQLAPGTAKLHYDAGQGYVVVDLVHAGGTTWNANFPPTPCGTAISWYVTAQSSNGLVWSYPEGAPSTVVQTTSASSVTPVVSHDFQVASGWTVGFTGDNATTGVWTRVDPNGTAAQPEDDHTPSPGTLCYVTGQGSAGGGVGDADVDGGKTTLVSPTLNLASVPQARISYWRWYSNNQGGAAGQDVFRVDVSNNNGTSWTNVETVGPSGAGTTGGWIHHEFALATFVAPTAQVKVRFVAEDAGSGSVVEAAIDDFRAFGIECASPVTAYCFGDGSLATACPCGNTGQPGRGCDNSSATGGALLASSGSTSPDTLALTSSGELAVSASVFLQSGSSNSAGIVFGDGVRCVVSPLLRLYVKNAVGGSVTAPAAGDPSISARSAALGDTIAPGSTRYYQVHYRDPQLGFCPGGDSFNVSNGLVVVW